MKRMKWERTLHGKAEYMNDANDYYYEWIDLTIEEEKHLDPLFDEPGIKDMSDLFQKYILNKGDGSIKIKVRDGAIFIVRTNGVVN